MNFFPRSWSQSQRSLRKSFPLISNKHRVWPSFIKGETYYPLYVTFAQLLALVLVDSHQGLLARKQDPAKEAVRFEACTKGVFWAGEIGACLCSYCGIRHLWFYDRWRLERVGARAKKGKGGGEKKNVLFSLPAASPASFDSPHFLLFLGVSTWRLNLPEENACTAGYAFRNICNKTCIADSKISLDFFCGRYFNL